MVLDGMGEEMEKGSQVRRTHQCSSINVTPIPCPGQSTDSAGVMMSDNQLAGKRADL